MEPKLNLRVNNKLLVTHSFGERLWDFQHDVRSNARFYFFRVHNNIFFWYNRFYRLNAWNSMQFDPFLL